MRKLSIFLSASLLAAATWADLGNVQVNSYLSQPLNASIPVSNLGAGVDYQNLSISLASGSKFKEYGLTFNPELGSLLFRMVKAPRGYNLQITSTNAIQSPVLTFLLHYSVDKNDFYKQYTILLDPVNYVDYATNNTSSGAGNKASGKHRLLKPIPLYAKAKIKPSNKPAAPKAAYEADSSNAFVAEHWSQYNNETKTFTTLKNDNDYLLAKFVQSLYPNANLTINQIILALGLSNYRQLLPIDGLFESGVKLILPAPENISKIPVEDATAYLLNNGLSAIQKQTLLSIIATKYSESQVIDSPNLFKSRAEIIFKSKYHQQPAPAPSYTKPSIWQQLWDYKYILVLSGIIIGGLLFIRKRLKSLSHKFKIWQRKAPHFETVSIVDDGGFTIQSIVNPAVTGAPLTPENIAVKPLTTAAINQAIANLANMPKPFSSKSTKSAAGQAVGSVVDEELISTLEQILIVDEGRDDIRAKLFELFLSAGRQDKALTTFHELDQKLDIDDPLRTAINETCSSYGFSQENPMSENLSMEPMALAVDASEVLTELEQDHNVFIPQVADIAGDTNPTKHNPSSPLESEEDKVFDDHERILDFSSIKDLNSVFGGDDTPPLVSDYAAERILSFEPSITESNPADPFEEKINLAKMYYHIDEQLKAKELLNSILNDITTPADIKAKIQEIIQEFGLNV